MNFWSKKSVVLLFLLVGVLIFAGCGGTQQASDTPAGDDMEKGTIIFADAGWDSIRFHNDVASIILDAGYGYETDVMVGSTPITFEGLKNGDIDVIIETWSSNIEGYDEAVATGAVEEIALNFGDNAQGLWVPAYVVNGDAERGIEAVAPDLKTVYDLPKYKDVFTDPEDPEKGRLLGAIPGWAADKILQAQVENYGLSDTYNYFSPGSDAALAGSMAGAYEKGEPWLGYYWTPTWVMGKYDMIYIEGEPYDEALWNDNYKCDFPPVPCTVTVNPSMNEKAPDAVEFLSHYETSSALTSEALAYMMDNEVGTAEAAKWFLENHEEVWTTWVSAEVAEAVKASL